jgi:alpha-beta hydrolase superfamily lysophospholipase
MHVPLKLPDGYETSVYVHRARGDAARPPVLYVHGIQSHPGWFFASAACLAERGNTVYQFTRRGSGGNHAGRGDARSAGQLLDDISAAVDFVRRDASADRVHLVGVSWGGKLLAAWAVARDAGPAASLTLVAPGMVPRVDVGAWTKVRIAAALMFCPRRRFDIPLSDPELFTENERMRAFLRADPAALHRGTARLLFASRRLDGMIRRAPRGAVRLPTTLLLARRDRIIDNPRTREAVERLTAGQAGIVEFDAAHVLEFEPDPRPFFDALVASLARGEASLG